MIEVRREIVSMIGSSDVVEVGVVEEWEPVDKVKCQRKDEKGAPTRECEEHLGLSDFEKFG